MHLSHPETQNLLDVYDDDKSGLIEFAEVNSLAKIEPATMRMCDDAVYLPPPLSVLAVSEDGGRLTIPGWPQQRQLLPAPPRWLGVRAC